MHDDDELTISSLFEMMINNDELMINHDEFGDLSL
jgi:hypothetical protein